MPFSTLYKMSSGGKIQEWNVNVEHFDGYSEISVVHGQQDGKKQTKITKIDKGKNLDKANATDHVSQSLSEARSKWNKQIDKGYTETVPTEKATDGLAIRPMLAKVYADHKHKIKSPMVQPKLDGQRTLAINNGTEWQLISRLGKPVNTVPHINEQLSKLSLKENVVLDGELYIHGESFQTLISGIKRDEGNEVSAQLEYHIYDCILLDKLDAPFTERLAFIQTLTSSGQIQIVNTQKCANEEEIFKWHSQFLTQKYEGSIVRESTGKYKIDGRSDQLLKLKEFRDAEFKIIGWELDKNEHPVFTCITDESKEFKVKMQGSDEERRAIVKSVDKYIGRLLTVKFFELSEDAIPRFPVGLRLYEGN